MADINLRIKLNDSNELINISVYSGEASGRKMAQQLADGEFTVGILTHHEPTVEWLSSKKGRRWSRD